MRQSFASEFQRGTTNMHYVGTRQVTIKGQPTELSISEGGLGAGTVRQATGVFDGKGGLAMVMIIGNVDAWDWAVFDQFCESIH